jgi:hypothetical protein
VYDNRDGRDYHIPVMGGTLSEPPLHIVHISVEMAPIAKVGGLGDVVTALGRAVQDAGRGLFTLAHFLAQTEPFLTQKTH